MVLAFDTGDEYPDHVDLYFGATVGPVAGHVADGHFRGGGLKLDLDPNEGTRHLHGGNAHAFDRVKWDVADASGHAVEFRLTRADGEDGYPGEVDVHAVYTLVGNELHLEFGASTTRPTPMNVVNHTSFNLSSDATASIVDHSLMIAATEVLASDERLLPTGGTRPVEGTGLDFRTERRIGEQLPTGGEPCPGADNRYVLDHDAPVAAVLHDRASGRTLTITTTEPTLQIYTGNRIPPLSGRSGTTYRPGSGICLEAQRVPDAPQLPE